MEIFQDGTKATIQIYFILYKLVQEDQEFIHMARNMDMTGQFGYASGSYEIRQLTEVYNIPCWWFV